MVDVHRDARRFEIGQHKGQRQLHLGEQRPRVDPVELGVEDLGQFDDGARFQHVLFGELRGSPVVVEQRELPVTGPVVGTQLTTEVAQGEVVEVEGALTGPHDVGRQRRVTGDPGEPPAPRPQRMNPPLDLVQGLAHRGVGKPVGKGLLVVGVHGGDIDVGRGAVGGGDCQAGGVGADHHMRCRDRESAASGAGVLGEPRPHLALPQHSSVQIEARFRFGRGGTQRREQSIAQNSELEIVEELVDAVAVPADHGQFVGPGRQLHVADQFGELTIGLHRRQVCAQCVADLALHLVDMIDEGGQRAVLPNPLRGRLLPHARDAGKVVAGVTTQRRIVRILRRGQAVLLLHLGRGEPRQIRDALARVEHRHRVVDQLQRIAVAGDDQHRVALGVGLGGERGDDVVGLVPLDRHHRDTQGVEHFLGEVDLTVELVRRLGSLRLVLGVHLRAEGLARDVEGGRDVRRFLIAEQVDEHRREAVDSVGGLPGRGLEVLGGQREERTVGQ